MSLRPSDDRLLVQDDYDEIDDDENDDDEEDDDEDDDDDEEEPETWQVDGRIREVPSWVDLSRLTA